MRRTRENLREHLTLGKSLVKPHPNPLLAKEREQESCFSSGIFALIEMLPNLLPTPLFVH